MFIGSTYPATWNARSTMKSAFFSIEKFTDFRGRFAASHVVGFGPWSVLRSIGRSWFASRIHSHVMVTFCLPQTSIWIFRVSQPCICNGLPTCFGSYLHHHQGIVYLTRGAHKMCSFFVTVLTLPSSSGLHTGRVKAGFGVCLRLWNFPPQDLEATWKT